jgi:hypothetical protein
MVSDQWHFALYYSLHPSHLTSQNMNVHYRYRAQTFRLLRTPVINSTKLVPWNKKNRCVINIWPHCFHVKKLKILGGFLTHVFALSSAYITHVWFGVSCTLTCETLKLLWHPRNLHRRSVQPSSGRI